MKVDKKNKGATMYENTLHNQPEQFPDSLERVYELQSELAETVRSVSYERAEYWQQVPYMALMADGINGYSPQKQNVYRDGLWCLSNIREGFIQYAVDCDNGNIVYTSNPEKPLADQHILTINPEELLAEHILQRLVEESQQELLSYGKSSEDLEQWRQGILEETGLQPIYQRHHIITHEEMALRAAKSLGEDLA